MYIHNRYKKILKFLLITQIPVKYRNFHVEEITLNKTFLSLCTSDIRIKNIKELQKKKTQYFFKRLINAEKSLKSM